MAALDTAPSPAPTDSGDDDLSHLYCCGPNLALCGTDLTNAFYDPDPSPERQCIVCYTLDDNGHICPECGQ